MRNNLSPNIDRDWTILLGGFLFLVMLLTGLHYFFFIEVEKRDEGQVIEESKISLERFDEAAYTRLLRSMDDTEKELKRLRESAPRIRDPRN